MESSRWSRVEGIYAAALGCSAAEREALLRERCGDDWQLMREVESLLHADASAGSFLGLGDLEAQIGALAVEPVPLAAGTLLGHYEILSQIAVGGMGDVYLAYDQGLDRKIALKLLPADFARDIPRVRRLLREAKVTSSLNHPNIVTVYEIGASGDAHFIASEFIEGATLRHLLQSRISVAGAIGIAIQCAKALDAAHRSGITHRDVKPENIMVRPDGLVKMLDFGLALLVDDAGNRRPGATFNTASGAVMGTPRYMSPEQARGQRLDHRTDIFSLGVVLYEMAAGVPPFAGATTAEVFAQLLGSTPRPLAELKRGLPPQLDRVISKAMNKDCGLRYQTMAAFAAELEAIQSAIARPGVSIHVDRADKRDLAGLSWTLTVPERRLRIPVRITAAAVVAAVFLSIAYRWRSTPEPVSANVLPITSFAGSKNHATFSPDGTQIAFAWDGAKKGNRDIYVKVVGAGEPLRITSAPEEDWLPAWSPDGRFIAFSRTVPTGQSVYLVPALGGEERKVADAGYGVSWLPDSKSLVLCAPLAPRGTGGLVLVSLETGASRQLTTPAPSADSLPAVSPDGRHVAFIRSVTSSAREVFVVPIGGGEGQRITFDKRPVLGVTWTGDSRYVVFASNRGGGESLWRVPASGGAPEPILPGLRSAFYPNISRTGQRLVFTQEYDDTNIYRYTGPGFDAAGVPGEFSAPEALIASSREDHGPAVSPDGRRIAFVSKRTGNEEIWISDRDGAHLSELTSFSGSATGTPRWSPDGRLIAFDSREAGRPNLYLSSPDGGPPHRLTDGPANSTVPSWSHDGKWLYFLSNRTGRDEVWRMPSSGGPAVQLTHTGARDALEGPAGKYVYFVKSGDWGIWSVRTDGTGEAVVPGLERAGRTRLWGLDSRGIYFVSKDAGPPHAVQWYSFATHRISTILRFDKEPFWNGPGLALSPDGRELLLVSLDQHVDDLMLIEDFR